MLQLNQVPESQGRREGCPKKLLGDADYLQQAVPKRKIG
jgi:hypothetical protein